MLVVEGHNGRGTVLSPGSGENVFDELLTAERVCGIRNDQTVVI